jgi:hypothetical protein
MTTKFQKSLPHNLHVQETAKSNFCEKFLKELKELFVKFVFNFHVLKILQPLFGNYFIQKKK